MRSPSKFLPPLAFALLAGAVACMAISSESFWIDEAETALKAVAPTLHGAWRVLYAEHNSNMQLPAYMLYIWAWARLFGVSEIGLRAANLPWFFLGIFAIVHFLRRHPGLRSATLLLYCLHPFLWFYLNEARPYVMQLSGSLLVAGALFTGLEEEANAFGSAWWWLFASGLAILCSASMLGIPWAAGVVILLIRRPGFCRSSLRAGRASLLLFVPFFVALAIYYIWTIKDKVGPGYLTMNLSSVLAVVYEQLGFLGLGPGRAELRTASFSILGPYILPLSLLGIPLAWGLFPAARRRFGLSAACLRSVFVLTATLVCLTFALGFIGHARILGRHLTPLFPFVLVGQAYALGLLWKSRNRVNRAAAGLIVIALALSSIELRFAARHSKDDYRAAAAAAVQDLAQGKTIWWGASPDGATYYHLPIVTGYAAPGAVLWVTRLPTHFATAPDLIFLSKPDLYDTDGSLSAFIAAHHYSRVAAYQSFMVWQK